MYLLGVNCMFTTADLSVHPHTQFRASSELEPHVVRGDHPHVNQVDSLTHYCVN